MLKFRVVSCFKVKKYNNNLIIWSQWCKEHCSLHVSVLVYFC